MEAKTAADADAQSEVLSSLLGRVQKLLILADDKRYV